MFEDAPRSMQEGTIGGAYPAETRKIPTGPKRGRTCDIVPRQADQAATKMRYYNNSFRAKAGRRWIVAVAALCLLIWRSAVVQTHVHAPTVPTAAMGAAGSTVHVASRSGSADDDDCPICHEAMRDGHYLTPIAFVVTARIATPFALPVIALSLWPHRHAAHGWYGRGPPSVSSLADR